MSYGGDYHRGQAIDIADWVLTGLSIVIVGMRVVSRTILTRQFGLDDAIMVVAVAALLCYVAVLSGAIHYGFGLHVWDVPKETAAKAGHLAIVASSLAVMTFAWPKLAIVALYQRLFSPNRFINILFWFLALGHWFCCLLLSIFWWAQCTPRAHQWDPMHVPGTCWNPNVLGNLAYFVAALSAVLDLTWAIYPLVIVHRLQMPLHKKIVTCVSLSGGFVAAIVVFYKITTLPGLNAQAKKDPTWADGPLLIWTTVEAACLIITASIPTIGPFVRFLMRRPQAHSHVTPSHPVGSSSAGQSYGTSSKMRRMFLGDGSRTLDSEAGDDDIHLVGMPRDATRPGPNEILKSVDVVAARETMSGRDHGMKQSYDFDRTFKH